MRSCDHCAATASARRYHRSVAGRVEERIEVIEGDITRLDVDAVVTAANAALSGGGGVDGAVHSAAGPQLLAECRTLGRCPPGQARMTGGYRLRARHVIHAVGPVWDGGTHGEAELLASAYRESLVLARDACLASIAFPAISTGVYGYPLEDAQAIAVNTVIAFLSQNARPARVVLCTFGARATRATRAALSASTP